LWLAWLSVLIKINQKKHGSKPDYNFNVRVGERKWGKKERGV
jgi:hypothetical protein